MKNKDMHKAIEESLKRYIDPNSPIIISDEELGYKIDDLIKQISNMANNKMTYGYILYNTTFKVVGIVLNQNDEYRIGLHPNQICLGELWLKQGDAIRFITKDRKKFISIVKRRIKLINSQLASGISFDKIRKFTRSDPRYSN